MSQLPLVTIVTPSFNQASFLEETILSVLRQDYPNIEYIIMDGGSTDGSVEIIKKYAKRLAYWASAKDHGQTDAIAKGFARSKGEYLAYLCSDDLLEPSAISISVDYHLKHPDVGLTFGDRARIDGKGNIYSLQRYPQFRPWFLRWFFNMPQETTLFKRSVFDAVGGFDESLRMVMDYDLWCKINKISMIRHIPAVLGRFRVHSNNKSTHFSKQLNQRKIDPLFGEYISVYERYFHTRPKLFLINYMKYLFNLLALRDRLSIRYKSETLRSTEIRLSNNHSYQ